MRVPLLTIVADFLERLKYSTADYEDSLLLAFHPLDNFVCTLGKTSARGIRSGDAIKFEEGRGPCERYTITAHTMEDLEMRVLCMG